MSYPSIVAPNTDGLVLVLRMGENKRNSAKRTTELIDTNNIRVLGVVCNATTADVEGYSYKETYGEYFSGSTAKQRPIAIKPTASPKVDAKSDQTPITV